MSKGQKRDAARRFYPGLPGYAAGYVLKGNLASIAPIENEGADLYIEWHAIDGPISVSGFGDIDYPDPLLEQEKYDRQIGGYSCSGGDPIPKTIGEFECEGEWVETADEVLPEAEPEIKDKDEESDNYLIPPDIVGESNWFPAIELYGEGVFFSFNEKLLSEWEKLPGVKKRAQQINKKYENSAVNIPYIDDLTPRFLLLHTIAHLIIRELEYSAGYSASSLMERIYCSSDQQMAGVLIYTAVADIVGSLGGIIESAEPKEFLRILSSAFEHAEWCSLDPVCTEHEGQGLGRLNRAACHACALSPETSCKFKNVFLDRIFIRGSKKLNIPSFLDFVKDYGQ